MRNNGGEPGHDGIGPIVPEADGGSEVMKVGWRWKGSPGTLGALWPWTESE